MHRALEKVAFCTGRDNGVGGRRGWSTQSQRGPHRCGKSRASLTKVSVTTEYHNIQDEWDGYTKIKSKIKYADELK